jgi:hypothetical protein
MVGKPATLLVLLLVMITLSGCSSDNSSLIVSSTPQDGATNFTLSEPAMKITVAKDLDPSTVNGATVRLRGQDNFTGRPVPVTGTVNYISGTRTISFTPVSGLIDNASYTMNLTGLKDADGSPLPDAAIAFTTPKVVLKLSASGLDSTYANGLPAGEYFRTEVDAEGNPSRIIHYDGAGPDGVWFTEDDHMLNYFDISVDYSSKSRRAVYHMSAGPDGAWFTADDPVKSYEVYTYSEGKEMVVYYGAGADGAWFTGDDSVSGYTVIKYNSDGSVSSIASYNSAGPDGTWFTADDVYTDYSTYLYDANGNMTRQAHSNGAGPDGIPFTADDPAITVAGSSANGTYTSSYSPGVTYTTMTYDTNNRPTSWASYEDPGPDGIWFTADDICRSSSTTDYDQGGKMLRQSFTSTGSHGFRFTSFHSFDYDAKGNLVRYVDYNDAGPDGIRFTADDKLSGYSSYVLNDAGKPLRVISYFDPGPDRVWFTADDRVSGYSDYSYDSSGNQVRMASYSPWPDGIKMTADDRPFRYEVTTYDTSGRLSMRSSYNSSGPDGVWFTADDRLSSRYEYAYP